MAFVLRSLGLASEGELNLDGPPSYLVSYDVNYRPSTDLFDIDVHGTMHLPPGARIMAPRDPAATGIATFSPDRSKAMRFPDSRSAFAAWQSRSTLVPTRSDGRPNRPLTAYSMTLEEVP